jgi:hypothetical protein
MSRCRKCVLICAWFAFFTALWLFAGSPIDHGRSGNRSAGFPLRFAAWNAGDLVEFQAWNLCFDIALGLLTLLGISWICVKSASTHRPISNIPKDLVLIGAVLMAVVLFFAPTFFALVDYLNRD